MSIQAVKLFMMTHHIPARISTSDAVKFYQTVAKVHGFRLERCGYGYVIA